ncbi:hypothetical protein NQ317_015436 [Molorchus minor]|uniref:Tyr recombinase domain-containing protein n=1 Tax=Molorchus minor TaxID=1323400 RepID=A0ABQ9J3C3_9CUCU|nr:hypothetical protein NQ317_015436 [Molorchus minor]
MSESAFFDIDKRAKYPKNYYQENKKTFRLQNVQKPTENALLAYFDEKSKVVCSSTLWAHYSMLKSVINIRENVDISKFPKVLAFFKRKNEGFKQKKSNVLMIEQVALITGVAGVCRGKELVVLEVNDVRDMGDFFLITVRNTKNKVDRNFVIKKKENSIDIVKIFRKYVALRKIETPHSKFFVHYINRECTKRPVVKNMFGHCFRRTSTSSTSLLADSGATIDVLKRHGGWKSSNVVEGNVESSYILKLFVSNFILPGFPSLFDPGGIECDTYQNRVKLLLYSRKCEKDIFLLTYMKTALFHSQYSGSATFAL